MSEVRELKVQCNQCATTVGESDPTLKHWVRISANNFSGPGVVKVENEKHTLHQLDFCCGKHLNAFFFGEQRKL